MTLLTAWWRTGMLRGKKLHWGRCCQFWLSNRIKAASELLYHHYHSLQAWLLVLAMPSSCQTLLMFLERVPYPFAQRSVLQTLRSPTCEKEKWDQTMPPCLTCLPPLFPLAVRSVCRRFPVHRWALWTVFRPISTGSSTVWHPDDWAWPGSRVPAAASSSEQDRWTKVRSGVRLSFCVEMKNTSS